MRIPERKDLPKLVNGQPFVLDEVIRYRTLHYPDWTPEGHVLNERPVVALWPRVRETLAELVAAGLLEADRGTYRATAAGLVCSRFAGPVTSMLEQLLSFFWASLAEEGAKFRQYTTQDLSLFAGVNPSDYMLAAMVIDAFDLAVGSQQGVGESGHLTATWTPPHINDVR